MKGCMTPSALRNAGESSVCASRRANSANANDTRKLITTAELLAGPPPDIVTIAGESGADEAWTVLSVATTTAFGGTHRMVMLGRGPLP